jgi:tetratricopeptide (TPR) repeat protein
MALYADFARSIGEADADRQEDIYRHAVELGDDALAINHYAGFLWYKRKNRVEAERWYRKAAELDTGFTFVDAAMRGIYAEMLWEWGDALAAENWWRLARTKSTMDVISTAKFAAMLLATYRVEEGLRLAGEVLSHPRIGTMSKEVVRSLELVSWFLRFAHGPVAGQSEALKEIHAHLHARPSPLWSTLSRNAEAAANAGQPNADLVAALAKALTAKRGEYDAALVELERCPAWRGR